MVLKKAYTNHRQIQNSLTGGTKSQHFVYGYYEELNVVLPYPNG